MNEENSKGKGVGHHPEVVSPESLSLSHSGETTSELFVESPTPSINDPAVSGKGY